MNGACKVLCFMFYLSENENDLIVLQLGKMGFIDFSYMLVILNLKRPFFTKVNSLYVCFLYDLWAQFDSDRK